MALAHLVYRRSEEGNIPGASLQAFIQNGAHYFMSEVRAYRDGMVDCWGLVTFEQFKEKVRAGWVRTQVPEGTRVSALASGVQFTATNVRGGIEEEEFIKQVGDEIEALNGRPTSIELCRAALAAFKEAPTEEGRARLRTAYESVPAHLRQALGGMDAKDSEYRSLLGIEK